MLKIDNSLLQEIGLGGLPEAEKNSFLKHIYETLEMRVGIRLADQMSNEQLDEFERYFEAKDDAGAFKWLETNFPNYKDIVQQEFDKLKGEVAQSAPQILAASQAQASQAQPIVGTPAAAAGSVYPPQLPQTPAPMPEAAFPAPTPAQPVSPPPQPFTPPQPPPPAQPYAAPPVPPMPQPSVQPAPPQPSQPQTPQPMAQPQPPYPQQQPPAGSAA